MNGVSEIVVLARHNPPFSLFIHLLFLGNEISFPHIVVNYREPNQFLRKVILLYIFLKNRQEAYLIITITNTFAGLSRVSTY